MFVPITLSMHVREFCRKVNPHSEPQYIAITPGTGCTENNCFRNVAEKVEHEGGRIQFGWSIWEWPRVALQAEKHAVYESPSGAPWADITPAKRVTCRLFLPDDIAEGVARDSKFLALNDDPLIQEFFAAAANRDAILNSIPGTGTVHVDIDTAKRLSAALQEKDRLFYKLGMKYTSQNASCFCGRGEKFKRCHGQKRESQ